MKAALRRPVWILHVFVVGLVVHNFAMAELYAAGIRGGALDVVSAWKEALLVLGLLIVLREHGSLRFQLQPVDWLALAFGAFVVVYGLIPQHVLGGAATHKGVLLGVRHDLLPVAAYFFGRGLNLSVRDARTLGVTVLATAAASAAFGLVDIYAIPLGWWRHSGVPSWYANQLGLTNKDLSNLPGNFVYNAGYDRPLRRLVSTFLSPLAESYALVVALFLSTTWYLQLKPRLVIWLPTTVLLFVALLFTHTRSAYIALALGLFVFALLRPGRRLGLVAAAVAVIVVGFAFVHVYTHVAPSSTYTVRELSFLDKEAHAAGPGAAANSSGNGNASENHEHFETLRQGISKVLHHPQGYGPGNSGSTAARTGADILAGESTYTELGIDVGLVGGLLFIAWSLVLLRRMLGCAAWLSAALVAVLALGLQTDVLGVPWLVFVLWPLFGWRISHPET